MAKILATIGVMALMAACVFVYYFRPPLYPIRAASSPNLKIGVVNVSVIKEQAKVYIEFENLVEERYRKENKEFLEKETELRNEFNELKKLWPDTTGTAPEKYVKRKQALDTRVEETEQLMRKRKEAIKTELTQYVQKIEGSIIQIIHEIGDERQLQLILNATMEQANTSLVLYGGKDLDITEEVLRRLNERLPSLGAAES